MAVRHRPKLPSPDYWQFWEADDVRITYYVLVLLILYVTFHSIHGIWTLTASWRVTAMNGGARRLGQVLTAGFDGRDSFWPRDGTVWAGFDDGTGRYGQVVSTGRDRKGIFPRRDGTVRIKGRWNCRWDGTGRDHGSILTTVLPSRPVPSLPSIPSRQ